MADGGNFTYPTATQYQFIVADLVNVTWNVTAPVVSLYELCGTNERLLREQQTNNQSYVWTATREGYVESGCEFMLQPFTTDLESYGNNITSVTVGVAKRYTDDPPPVEYNFVNASSSSTATTTTTSSTPLSTAGTGTGSESTQPTDSQSTPESQGSGSGLSTTEKLGIGLGVPLGVLLVAAIVGAIIFYRRRLRQRHRTSREISATSQLEWGGGSGALSSNPGYKPEDLQQMRLSQAETATRFSQLSTIGDHFERTQGVERPRSELMSMERAELG